MIAQGAPSSVWNQWHVTDGPRYPHSKVIQFCLRNFKAADRPNIMALDLGCGNGVNSLFLLHEGFKVKGIDFAEIGVEKARKASSKAGFQAEFEVARIDQNFFEGQKFDLIISIGVLDCAGLEASMTSISNMSKVLKDGGRGLFLFASDLDFRLTLKTDLSINGYSSEEVKQIFEEKFVEVNYDRYITTYENGKSQQNDWLITVKN